jgi:DNA polymerase-3 subunit epsilon/ATP-dependent DNA helicase DinG
METLVALDLETTGLDIERDAIIEIGAVRFRGSRVEAEWSSLVNPGRPLPPFIVQLTGITDDMLSTAPRFSGVLAELADFIGDAPVLGHNIGFDLGFLRRKGLFDQNPTLDTFDLASVLLPSAGRYRLASLAELLGIPVLERHRALEDARTTRAVYLALTEKLESLPLPLLEEIVHLGEEIEWGAGWAFEEALDHALASRRRKASPSIPIPPAEHVAPPAAEALHPVEPTVPLDAEELAALLEPGGPFAKRFPHYEHRAQQVAMLRAVAQAFSQRRHLLVEAGTGTGKSVAYLIPALAWAEQNGQRVVISTHTINLQDQLIHKDLPDLCETLGASYRGAVLKGRGNYLCPRRLTALRQLRPQSADEMRLLAKVLVWLMQGGSGDRSEINLTGPWEAAAWSRLSADTEECSAEVCQARMGQTCPYFQARQQAETAHVVVVNHALLLADIATGGRVLPEYRYLIVDEAHQLEDAVTNGLAFRAVQGDVERLLKEIGGPRSGLLGEVLAVARRDLPPDMVGPIEQSAGDISRRASECIALAQQFFDRVADFLAKQREQEEIGPYPQQHRITSSTRTLPDWEPLELAWENLRGPLGSVVEALRQAADLLAELGDDEADTAENLALALRGSLRGLEEFRSNLEQMVFEPSADMVYWAEARPAPGRISLHAAPVRIGPLVDRFLWREKEAVVMTSATLTASGDFGHLRSRLQAEDADELALGSPFDFESSTLLYLVTDVPEPSNRQAYEKAVENGLIQLCKATRGRTLALFTSYEQLRRASRAITDPLAAEGIVVFEQGEGASRHALLESFRSTEQAVLLGTRSFWEGIDVPGKALSVLAIVRLPFDVPSDPIIAARMESYEDPFTEYSIPEAVLRFRQGFGRLIRTRSDRGVVAVMDRRILSKPYGRAFVQSLPRCTTRQGPLQDLPAAAYRWLGM